MALRKSTKLLPEVFQTSKNTKFLNATLDQLISEDNKIRVNNYIGRVKAENYKSGDSYVIEPTNARQNYQLEPGVVYRNPTGDVDTANSIHDFHDALRYNNGNIDNQDILSKQQYYSWKGFHDFDKLINFGEYFWLPDGPNSVQVFAGEVDATHDYDVLREGTTYKEVQYDSLGFGEQPFDGVTETINTGGLNYRFDNEDTDPNKTLYLARGGEYTFNVSQINVPFWIQTEPGLSGLDAVHNTIDTRDILGVINNGEDNGVVTFRVPEVDDQNIFLEMALTAEVDLATNLTYNQIHNEALTDFIQNHGGIDSLTELDNKTLIMFNPTEDETQWQKDSIDLDLSTRYGVFEINITSVLGVDTIQLSHILDIPEATKVSVKQGTVYSSREFYKNISKLELIPPIVANKTEFYYQDGKDADRFGKIVLVELGGTDILDITKDVLNKKTYTSPNNVVFTNGLKVEFDSTVTPDAYKNNTYYVEGVGTSIKLILTDDLITPEPYTDNISEGFDVLPFDEGNFSGTFNSPASHDYIVINRAAYDNNPWSRTNRWFHRSVITATAEYNNYTPIIDDTQRAKRPIIEFEAGLRLFNFGTTSKSPVSVIDTVETDAFSNVNGKPGYFVDGIDLTPGLTVCFINDPDINKNIYEVQFIDHDAVNVTSPIINLVLKDTVSDSDALLSTLGSTSQGIMYWFNGVTNIWEMAQQKTALNQEPMFDVFDGDGISFSDTATYPGSLFTGSKLFSYKRGTTTNDVVLNFPLTYKNFNNLGDIVFENNFIKDEFKYTKGTEGNVVVIVKSGHVEKLVNDSVKYENGWQKVISDSKQFQLVQHLVDEELHTFEIGAAPVEIPDEVTLQIFVNGTFQDPDKYTTLDLNTRYYINFVAPLAKDDVVLIRCYSNEINTLGFYEIPENLENNADNNDFTILTLGQCRNHLMELSRGIPTFKGTSLGLNNIRDLDYKKYPGKILQHSAGMILPMYLMTQEDNTVIDSIRFSMEEYTRFKNRFIDNINTLDIDLRDPVSSTDKIITTMASTKSNAFPFFYSDMIPWGSKKSTTTITIDRPQERLFSFTSVFTLEDISSTGVLVYIKRANVSIQLIHNSDYTFSSSEPSIILRDEIELHPGDELSIIEYSNTDGSFIPVTPTKLGLWPKSDPSITLDSSYQSSVVSSTGPYKIYATTNTLSDQLNTDTKWFYPVYTTQDAASQADVDAGGSGETVVYNFLGADRLFFKPVSEISDPDEIIEYPEYTPVIIGHDGSKWVAYKDARDLIILELEKRIYNNIKVQQDRTIFDWGSVFAGHYRTDLTDLKEETAIWRSFFASWAYKNKVNYTSNTIHDVSNPLTWNYTSGALTDSNTRSFGHWRGLYKWIYDTETPHLTPWEMLGLQDKPLWWDEKYGTAPYTSGNLILWEDLRDGKLFHGSVTDPSHVVVADSEYVILENRKRPTLMDMLPVDSQGKLRSPADFAVTGVYSTNSDQPWSIGDHAPAETAYKRSSEWPFVAQVIAAIKQPAKYFSLMFDVNLLQYNKDYDQILQVNKSYRPSVLDYKLHGSESDSGVNRVYGFNQFIVNHLKYKNMDIQDFETKIQNLELNLMYPVAGFTDKSFMKLLIETASPGSDKNNIFIPDENISVVQHKSMPTDRVMYSGVNIIKQDNGYEIRGFDQSNPLFKIVPSVKSENTEFITVGTSTVNLYRDFDRVVVNVPYGTIIPTVQQTIDFLNAYSRYLDIKGVQFTELNPDGKIMNFETSIKEFMFWTEQGWPVNSAFSISPAREKLTITQTSSTTDNLTGKLKNSNNKPIRLSSFNVERIDNTSTIHIDNNNDLLYAAELNPIHYEHYLVLDNTTIFNDVIYQPELGNRHSRIKFIGHKAGNWNGTMHAPGFIINKNEFNLWNINTDYNKGALVSFRNKLYAAKEFVDGKSNFDYNDWNYVENIKTGMLPNLSSRSERFNDFFDIDVVNLENEVSIAGKGQIGFKKRDYLDNLGIDDVSQVKFYQNLLQTKGTKEVINKLVQADLNNLDQEIEMYEEWAFRVGEYGSIDSNQVIELKIDDANIKTNSSIIEFLNNGETVSNELYYGFTKDEIFKLPNNYSKNVFNTREYNTKTSDIINAGYARLDDVDFTVFDINQISSLDNNIDSIGRGTTIWVAKDGPASNVYRVQETDVKITSVNKQTNNFVVFETDKTHNLDSGDIVVVKSNDASIRGFKKISSVPGYNKFAIETDADIDNINDISIPLYTLISVKFPTLNALVNATPVNGWSKGEKVWVDADETNKWAVYNKKEPFQLSTHLVEKSVTDDFYGSSIAISNDSLTLVIGASGDNQGSAYTYVKNEQNKYALNLMLEEADLNNTLSLFGHKIVTGSKWLAVSAPGSNTNKGYVFIYQRDAVGAYIFKQILNIDGIGANAEFGTDLAISKNDKFLYISAPGINTVYTYILDDQTDTQASITGDGVTDTFTVSMTGNVSILDSANKHYIPYIDFTIVGGDVVFTTSPANGLVLIIRQQSNYKLTNTISTSGINDKFGHSLACDARGETIVVGSPYSDVTSGDVYSNAGVAYMYHHIIDTFTGDNITTDYTASYTLIDTVYVEVNNIAQTPDTDYTLVNDTISFNSAPVSGDSIQIYTSNFSEIQRFTNPTVATDDEFGSSVSIDSYGSVVAIGAPGEDEMNPNTGSVFVYIDEGMKFGNVTTVSDLSAFQLAGDSIYINDHKVDITTTSSLPEDLRSDILNSDIPGITVQTDSQLTIRSDSEVANRKLKVRPGSGNTFRSLAEFTPFKFTQKINHPLAADNENFGSLVKFDEGSSQNLVIASERASVLVTTDFDLDTDTTSLTYNEYTTTFDANSTKFVDKKIQSGAAYMYEMLEASVTDTVTASISNPPEFVYSQQLTAPGMDSLDGFGNAVVYNSNRLFVGSYLDDADDVNTGSVYYYVSDADSAWEKYRSEADKVDVAVINRAVTYNRLSSEIISFLDTVDIYKNKLPGSAQAELDFITDFDPASYNISTDSESRTTSETNYWDTSEQGKIWWDLNTCRVLEYEQGDTQYRVDHWNTFFPGSSIDIYEWVESDVLPSEYTSGVPKYADNSNYSVSIVYNNTTNTNVEKYYFWATGLVSYPSNTHRTMSTESVRKLLENPTSAGIKYINVVAPNIVQMNNISTEFSSDNVVLSLNYDVIKNDGVLHSEFELVAENDSTQILPPRIINKIIDSLTGADITGQVVPDPLLMSTERYGIGIRPRQSLFKNRREALKIFVEYCNSVFRKIPIGMHNNLSAISTQEPIPTISSNEWDNQVDNLIERDYIDTALLVEGYKILVKNDEIHNDNWTIYVLENNTWVLNRVQSYNTTKYWNKVTWYAEGYSNNTVVTHQVNDLTDLGLLEADTDDIARVLHNIMGKNSLFIRTAESTWEEISIQEGTIELDTVLYTYANTDSNNNVGFGSGSFDSGSFDSVPAKEIRNIFNAIHDDIFKDTLHMNELFFRLVEFSLHETHTQFDWAFKTSFVRVLHKLRNLSQYPTFTNDNNTFIEDFINEVKPYHTKIREYVTKFDGNDSINASVTDFDIHSFYDETSDYYRKPSGDYQGDELLREIGNNNPWFNNYTYYLDNVVIYNAGINYTVDPIVTVSSPDLATGTQAVIKAISNGNSIVRVEILNKGTGYTKTPTITIDGTGNDLVLLPRIKNDVVRKFDISMKFDRITYSSTVKEWQPNTVYDYNDLVTYTHSSGVKELYKVDITDGFTSSDTFSAENTTGNTVLVVYDDGALTNNADRIAAYYSPNSGMIGNDLRLLQHGTDYTGTRVSGVEFNLEPGYSSAGFDSIGFDDFSVDANGLSVLSSSTVLDTIIKSNYSDLALGTRPEDINIDGGEFVDVYNSHAPEELIPGIVFDTLDIEVYTDPSDDFLADGNTFPMMSDVHVGDGVTDTFSFDSNKLIDNMFVWVNSTAQRDFIIDFENKNVVLPTPPLSGEKIHIYGYGISGKKITHEQVFIGDGVTDELELGIHEDLSTQILVLNDGVPVTFTTSVNQGTVVITLALIPTVGDYIHVLTSSDESPLVFTYPVVEEINLTSGTYTYDLTNTIDHSKPLESNVIVELDNERLRPANAVHYTLDGSTVVYKTPRSAGETVSSVHTGDINVTYINRDTNELINLDYLQDYTVGTQLADDLVTLETIITLSDVYVSGHELIVSVDTNSAYFIEASGQSIRLDTSLVYTTNDKLYITSFNNYEPLRIQTKVFVGFDTDSVITVEEFDTEPFDSVGFDSDSVASVTVSKYALDRVPSNKNNLWITIDGIRVHNNSYSIDSNGRVDLSNYPITSSTEIVITHLSENFYHSTVGYRMVKNMLGDYEYYRISDSASTTLTADLNLNDTKIYVQDASRLQSASPDSTDVGVIYINNERITYWDINTTENYITNIRRGTYGTQITNLHQSGAVVYNTSSGQELPATNTHTNTWYNVGAVSAADGKGLQAANTINANFIKKEKVTTPVYPAE